MIAPTSLALHEYDAICQRCGRRETRMAIDADAPPEGFFRICCDDCAAGDDAGRDAA